MGQRLKRQLGPVTSLDAGEWTDLTATGAPAVCCPECGGVSDLELGVHVGGVVAMEWACPFASCSYRGFLTLEAWGEEVVR